MEGQKPDKQEIKTLTDIVRFIPEPAQNMFFKHLSPGYVGAFSNTDEDSKNTVSDYFEQLPSTKKWQLGYTVIFMKNYSEIQLRCEDPSKNFKWKFMDSKLFHESEEKEERGREEFTYGVSTADNTIRAVKHLRRIMEIFPAPIDKLMIYDVAFIRKDIALEISKIGEVKLMYIDGMGEDITTRWKSEEYDILLKNITVRDQLHAIYISGKKPIVPSMIAQIPIARLDFPSAPAPEVLFAAASQKKIFRISEGPTSFFNSFIHCWLKSKRCDMDVLRISIEKYTDRSNNSSLTGAKLFDGLFDGLTFVEGTQVRPHPYGEKPITEWNHFKFLLARDGFEIRRKDGATLCLCYWSANQGAILSLVADYPEHSTRAEKMDSYCDRYAHILQVSGDFIEHRQTLLLLGDENGRVGIWFEKNKAILDAAEMTRYYRFQAADQFKTTVTRSMYWCEDALRMLLELEIRQFFQAAYRKTYGYFELEKKSRWWCIF